MSEYINLPPEQLSYKKKTKAWRKMHLDWADSKTFFNYSPVRKSVMHKKINYDLLNGKLHMEDLEQVLNPEALKSEYTPDRIIHYPIMNAKLRVLNGEESRRPFEYQVVVTNPNAISEIQEEKKKQIVESLKEFVKQFAQQQPQNEVQQQQQDQVQNEYLDKMNEYFTYSYKDMREVRANCLLNHYSKEYNFKNLFNIGFMDAMANGEEIYHCDIVGGEPIIERVNPLLLQVLMSGYSNRIEDADVLIYEDYLSPGKIIEMYYDCLSEKDMKYINELPNMIKNGPSDKMDNIDERYGFVNNAMIGEEFSNNNGMYFDPFNLFSEAPQYSLLPYDLNGNIRVLRMYWKSRRKIKRVKTYDPQSGEEDYHFYTEDYICDESKGEEEEIFWVNEAWEGTKIGAEIYVNMRPRPIQYNRLSNPSRCHFGYVGSVYNLNDSRPYSMVDMMKPYNYLYDIIHDRLNKMMARNWGKIVQLDLAKVPKGWDIEKWIYYAKANGLAVVDSFKEGNYGSATGKLAGGLNNNTSGVIDADFGNNIQQYINLLEYIKGEMSEVVGITKQREGQTFASETAHGVERATIQSNHITEWLFVQHDDVKRRTLECFLETAKIAMRGRSKKFQYLVSDGSIKMMDIDGDEFSECDYGIVVDNSEGTLQLSQRIDDMAQAALQGKLITFSALMKLYSSASLSEKRRMIENSENQAMQQQQQQQQSQQQSQEKMQQMQMQQKQAEMQLQDKLNARDNQTRIETARIQSLSNLQLNADRIQGDTQRDMLKGQMDQQQSMIDNQAAQAQQATDGVSEPYNKDKAQLMEKMRQFDEKLRLDREKLNRQDLLNNNKINLEMEKLKIQAKQKQQQSNSK